VALQKQDHQHSSVAAAEFPRPQAYRQAYEQGVKIAGVTAHFVSMRLDEGPIIAQGSFPSGRHGAQELITRGQQLEAGVLVKAVKLILANGSTFIGRGEGGLIQLAGNSANGAGINARISSPLMASSSFVQCRGAGGLKFSTRLN